MKVRLSALFATAALYAATMASAAPKLSYAAGNPVAAVGGKVASGSASGMNWTAWNRIIGMTPTSVDVTPGVAGGGNPLFFPAANKSGVVALIMDYGPGGAFICSGSLMSDRTSIVTAAHCVSDGFGTAGPLRTTAYFFTGDPNARTPFNPAARAVEVSRILVNPGYSGEVIDQNDIAVLKLSRGVFGVDAYDFADDTDLTGKRFNVAGYGGRSNIGGAFGVNARTGFLREGDNTYDYTWGDAEFGGFFTDRDGTGEAFFGFADYEQSWVSDFDSGFAANDMSCRIAAAVGASAGFGCNTGVGAREVGVAGGDSGGPQFINGRLASVTSYGLTFGTAFGDCRAGLNSSCGEYSGYVPVNIHRQWLAGAMAVPEPQSWALLITGFGLTGAVARRRRRAAVAA